MEKVEETIDSLNYISKNVNKLRKEYLKVLEKEKREKQNKTKQKESNSYYLEPVKVSSVFIQFFKLIPEHEYSRIYCYRKVFEYLKKHQLLTLDEITISSDIQCLFKENDVKLLNLHKCLEWHFT
jgi:hypothetical protein